MDRAKILEVIKSLSMSQGFYCRLLERLTDGSEQAEKMMQCLEAQHFSDAVDLVMFVEC